MAALYKAFGNQYRTAFYFFITWLTTLNLLSFQHLYLQRIYKNCEGDNNNTLLQIIQQQRKYIDHVQDGGEGDTESTHHARMRPPFPRPQDMHFQDVVGRSPCIYFSVLYVTLLSQNLQIDLHKHKQETATGETKES